MPEIGGSHPSTYLHLSFVVSSGNMRWGGESRLDSGREPRYKDHIEGSSESGKVGPAIQVIAVGIVVSSRTLGVTWVELEGGETRRAAELEFQSQIRRRQGFPRLFPQ